MTTTILTFCAAMVLYTAYKAVKAYKESKESERRYNSYPKTGKVRITKDLLQLDEHEHALRN